MKTFNELWRFITQQRPGVITVQERSELEHVFNLMQGCQSYLEVGTAEGNSLYVLSHALREDAAIEYIDLGELHTFAAREEMIAKIKQVTHAVLGDSTHKDTYDCLENKQFDCVLIDGGHDYTTVLSDAMLYAPLATKYIFFHDIQLPEVRAAVEWWHKRWQLGKYTEFINSNSFGYAVIEVQK